VIGQLLRVQGGRVEEGGLALLLEGAEGSRGRERIGGRGERIGRGLGRLGGRGREVEQIIDAERVVGRGLLLQHIQVPA